MFLFFSLFPGVYDCFILYKMLAAELCRTSQTVLTPEGDYAAHQLLEGVGSPVKIKMEVEETTGETPRRTSLEELHWTMRAPFTVFAVKSSDSC